MDNANEVLKPRITVIADEVTTTSLAVAEHFGKRHDDVLKRIRSLDCSREFHLRNFAEMFREVSVGKGAVRKEPYFRMTKNGFAFLVMGFTGKPAARWKEAYINAFDAMDKELTRRLQSEQQRQAIKSQSTDLLLRLNYELDQEYGQAAVLWLLIQSGALDSWIEKTYRQIEDDLDGFLSRNGALKAMRKLVQRRLVVTLSGKTVRSPKQFLVLDKALQELLLGVADLKAPGLISPLSKPEFGRLH